MKFARFLSGLPLIAAAILLLAAAPGARAAVFACANNEIQGDATAPGFEGCIDVLSFGEAIQIPVDTTAGTGHTAGTPNVGPFRLIKPLDRTSPVWRDKLLSGAEVTEVTITFTTTGDQGFDIYFEIKLSNVLVSEISMTNDQNGVPTEVISLDAASVEWSYTPYDGAGNQGAKIISSWAHGGGAS